MICPKHGDFGAHFNECPQCNLEAVASREESVAKKRLGEMMMYICQKSKDDPNFNVEKLKSLLFQCDMQAFLETGKTISGATYFKEPTVAGTSDPSSVAASETPRTDEIMKLIREAGNADTCVAMNAYRDGVKWAIKRLERELTAARAEIARLNQILSGQ